MPPSRGSPRRRAVRRAVARFAAPSRRGSVGVRRAVAAGERPGERSAVRRAVAAGNAWRFAAQPPRRNGGNAWRFAVQPPRGRHVRVG
jgi:hypothetical protein